YLMGKLTGRKRALFEMHFINCERCIEMLEETALLRRTLRDHWPEEISQAATTPSPVRPFARPLWRMVAMACILALLAALPAIFFFRETRRLQSELEETKALYAAQREPQPEVRQTAPASTDQKPTPPLARQSDERREKSATRLSDDSRAQTNTPVFVLAASRRGEADTNEVVTDGSKRWLLISLELEGDTGHETYRATITSDVRPSWRSGPLRPNQYNALTMSFRSDALPPGQYLLTLEGVSKTGETKAVANYPFRVTKKT
ncbi:MAG TPA: hypothetical protein VID27_07390, partial [Blastocatellia bacterium]